jgi:hypothetical protein
VRVGKTVASQPSIPPLSPLLDRMSLSLQLLCSLRLADTAHIGPAHYATRSSSVVLATRCQQCLSHWLTPRRGAPPEMPLENFPPSCGTRKVHYRAHKSTHRSLSWVRRIRFIFLHPVSSEILFNIIFTSTSRISQLHLPSLHPWPFYI